MWDERFRDGHREALGTPLSGDSVGGAYVPVVARIEQDIRTAGAVPGFVASLGRGLLALRAERRTTPLAIEWGVTDRLALQVMLPLVRVFTRAHLALDPATANLGLNPLLTDPSTAEPAYQTFFTQFDQALAQLDQNIAAGAYGCPGSPQCTQAMAFLTDARSVHDALARTTYGPGTAGGAPFLPLGTSDGGQGIDGNIARLQQELSATYGVGGFTQTFLLPVDPVDTAQFDQALTDAGLGFGLDSFADTPRRLRFWPGDAEVGIRFRVVRSASYAATIGGLVRLPTGHRDSPGDPVDLATGDGQTDYEAQLVQELIVARRLWLTVSLRGAVQQATTRARRVAGPLAFLVPAGAAAMTRWDPGDYLAIDFAPLYRFSPYFAAGVTLGYFSRAPDHTTYATPGDSLAVAAGVGTPLPAALLDAGSSLRRTRVGIALTYVGPAVEGGLSVERTASATGGLAAAATVFRIVLRASRWPF